MVSSLWQFCCVRYEWHPIWWHNRWLLSFQNPSRNSKLTFLIGSFILRLLEFEKLFAKHLTSAKNGKHNAYKETRAQWLTKSVFRSIPKDVHPKAKDWRRLLLLRPHWNGPVHLYHFITVVKNKHQSKGMIPHYLEKCPEMSIWHAIMCAKHILSNVIKFYKKIFF